MGLEILVKRNLYCTIKNLIINFSKNNQNKNSEDKFQECLKIIKENNLRKDDKNGK